MMGKLHVELRDELQMLRSMIQNKETDMHYKLYHEPKSNIHDVTVDTENVLVTVYARDLKEAYAFTDAFLLPRKVVRIMIGVRCYNV